MPAVPFIYDSKTNQGSHWEGTEKVHCKNELHLMHFCNGTYLSQNHEHLRHIKHIRYKITVTCSTSAMPQAHGALYITSAKIGWGAWSASCMGISRYLLSLTRMEWNWAPPQAHGSCTMRLNILNPCAWCEHRFYSVHTGDYVRLWRTAWIGLLTNPSRFLWERPRLGTSDTSYT